MVGAFCTVTVGTIAGAVVGSLRKGTKLAVSILSGVFYVLGRFFSPHVFSAFERPPYLLVFLLAFGLPMMLVGFLIGASARTLKHHWLYGILAAVLPICVLF